MLCLIFALICLFSTSLFFALKPLNTSLPSYCTSYHFAMKYQNVGIDMSCMQNEIRSSFYDIKDAKIKNVHTRRFVILYSCILFCPFFVNAEMLLIWLNTVACCNNKLINMTYTAYYDTILTSQPLLSSLNLYWILQ